ncbi:MAG: DUF4430 domain-containing protein, partial [Candidatus Bathyarchaeota archaeon]|uniref:DUF4430 domain-containing protein n=1 Tax=Candidatus Bathycorpusculum sp. TaxID=2994959 RepID=UPI00282B2B1E|nr:DUF4430 domain-containing protein [Candidatus Termiticorpusculum sp.]
MNSLCSYSKIKLKSPVKRLNAVISVMLALVMVLGMLPLSALAAETSGGGATDGDGTMIDNIITNTHLAFNQYETFYYLESEEFYYNDHLVEFISGTQFTAGGTTYNLKNQKVEIAVTVDDDTATVKFVPNIALPIGTIAGQWNSGSGGTRYIYYKSDIPGQPEVHSANNNYNTITITGLTSGTYHLTDGSFFEKANPFSPGTNLGKGVVTEAYFGRLPDVTITVATQSMPAQLDYVPDDFENNLWLQYNFKELKTGETAAIYPRRVEQAFTDIINNNVERPNFNFEIVEGDSISLDLTRTALCTNSAWRDRATVTAVKPGVTIVKVTYDAFTHSGGKVFPACSEVNAAYVAFSVTDETNTGISINFNDLLTSYDTVYFTGDYVNYAISPIITGAVTIEVTCNGVPVTGNNGSYDMPLQNMQNIVAIKATNADGQNKYSYKMIDARLIEINVVNKYNPGKAIAAGDIATVSFKGITLPVYKLATIYNPILGSSSYVQYTSTIGTFQGRSAQYDLATRNSFDVLFANAGVYTFTNGRIYEAWYGDALGSDKNKEGIGNANLNAATNTGWFSVMPDFTINVEASEIELEDTYDPVTGWFTIYNPDGYLLIKLEALLDKTFGEDVSKGSINAAQRPRGYTYNEVTKLRIVGATTSADFIGTSTQTQDYGMRRNWGGGLPSDNPVTRLNNLQELDLSGITLINLPTAAFWPLPSLTTLKLPVGVSFPTGTIIGDGLEVFRGCTALTTVVCGDVPLAVGVLDLSGSSTTTFRRSAATSFNRFTKVVFPNNSDGIQIVDSGTGNPLSFPTAKEIVFLGKVNYIGNSYAFFTSSTLETVVFMYDTAPGSISDNSFSAKPVAYVPDPSSGGYELESFTKFFSSVKPLTVDTTKLVVTIAEAEALTENDYLTVAKWTTMQTALTNAITTLNGVAGSPESEWPAQRVTVETALFELRAAINALVYVGDLNAVIDRAELFNATDFTSDSWAIFDGALAGAKLLLEDDSVDQEVVDMTVFALEVAIDGLVEFVPADKIELIAAIEKAEGLVEAEYTTETWTPFVAALQGAQLVAENYYATQMQVNEAKNTLTVTMNNLLKLDVTGDIVVTFRLIGSTLSDGEIMFMFDDFENFPDYKGAEYQTWIATKTYVMSEGASIYDLFVTALADAGLAYVGAESNYVSAIFAPDCLGGYKLAEIANGPLSGWMYTVNGVHPGYGLKEQPLHDGDVVIWHYVNDFLYEVEDWFYGSLGDSTMWSKWLEASDVDPLKPIVYGDVNGDGVVNRFDQTVLNQYFSGTLSVGAVFIMANADVNGDGVFN